MVYTGITGTTQGAAPNLDPGVICGANLDLSGILPAGQVGNCFSDDGEMWIGSTAVSAGGTHSKIGKITGSGGVLVTYGSGSVNVAGTGPSTDLHAPRFIVASSTAGTGANFTSIAAAIAAAQGTGINSTIFLQPGTYTENVTLVPGINLCAFSCDALTPNVIIVGTCTLTTAGTVTIAGIRLKTNSANLLAVTGSAASIVNLIECYLDCTNNTGIALSSSNAASAINLYLCQGNVGTTGISLFANSGAGTIAFQQCCAFTNSGNSLTASTVSGSGGLQLINSVFNFNITTSSTSSFLCYGCIIQPSTLNITGLTLGGSGLHQVFNTEIAAGSASAISIGASGVVTVVFCTIVSSNTNAITGSGSITYNNLNFLGSSSLINTTTQVPNVSSNDALKIVTPGAYPYTTTPQDAVIKVDTSSARTITPLASPTTGQMHIIKDTVGSAASNNITITPSGKNIDGAASSTINIAYGSATIVYNGTEWNLI